MVEYCRSQFVVDVSLFEVSALTTRASKSQNPPSQWLSTKSMPNALKITSIISTCDGCDDKARPTDAALLLGAQLRTRRHRRKQTGPFGHRADLPVPLKTREDRLCNKTIKAAASTHATVWTEACQPHASVPVSQ